ncbi:MAG: putative metal-dependent hydrolase [Parcubacteria group bacterium Athens1014_10]|nr:MAG: putative metal-dependent hydrolase [Parcubacteria group bacterium Athens1014_10]TSD05960.1 MAG: putative metal-dependent hydrolase [Parcubacteria group bacterium Athens0714_12]
MKRKDYSEQRREIILCNQNVGYILRTSKKARRMRLVVYCDSSLVVTKPMRLSDNIAEKFIIQKASWILSKLEHFKKFKNIPIKNSRGNYLKYKEEARKLVNERINYFNKIYNFKFNKINIKNQKTRWGSCSKKRNLNFNYKIVLLPENFAGYIIAHELCHLKEFNHSRNFWNLLAETIPDYSKIKKQLKHKGLNYY